MISGKGVLNNANESRLKMVYRHLWTVLPWPVVPDEKLHQNKYYSNNNNKTFMAVTEKSLHSSLGALNTTNNNNGNFYRALSIKN